MRAFSVSVLLLLSVLLLAGCTARDPAARAFSYAEQDFSAEVTGSVTRLSADGYTGDASLVGERLTDTPQDFSAAVTARVGKGDAEAGEPVLCSLEVTYTDPPALRGMTVTYTRGDAGQARVVATRTVADGSGGDRTITIDLSATDPAVRDALLAPGAVLWPTGDVTAVSPTSGGMYKITRSEGAGDGAREAIFSFSEGQNLPVGVVWSSPARRVEIEIKQG